LILTYSNLFADNSSTESITLVAKFTTILSEIIADPKNNLELEFVLIDDKYDLICKPNNDVLIVSKIDCIFRVNLGLLIGIIVGIAIQTSLLLIFRQKNT
jgi:hypothetical protein